MASEPGFIHVRTHILVVSSDRTGIRPKLLPWPTSASLSLSLDVRTRTIEFPAKTWKNIVLNFLKWRKLKLHKGVDRGVSHTNAVTQTAAEQISTHEKVLMIFSLINQVVCMHCMESSITRHCPRMLFRTYGIVFDDCYGYSLRWYSAMNIAVI